MALRQFTDYQVIQQLDSGYRWYGHQVRYAFPENAAYTTHTAGEDAGFVQLNAQQQWLAQIALQAWDDLIKPTLSNTTGADADIDLAYSSTGVDFAHAYYPPQGTAWFSTHSETLANPMLGQYGFETYLHEIGHTLGLDHMGNYNGAGHWNPSSFQDSSVYTVMSYFGPEHSDTPAEVATADWTGSDGEDYCPQTPMLNDIMAIQAIYGAGSARNENTVYGFGSNITGAMTDVFDFNANKHPILSIYDTGGTDTLNLSEWATASTIDLSPGAFSSANAMTKNLAIARNTIIEDCITGSGDDFVQGNAVDNQLAGNAGADTLSGGAGNDWLDGGGGTDIAAYSGVRANYLINDGFGNGDFIVKNLTGAEGTDTLHGIETLRFADGTISTDALKFSVVRYYNEVTKAHFYTSDANDMALLESTYTDYHLEKEAFKSAAINASDAVDVYRFYNDSTHAHFYTASQADVDYIGNNLPQFNNEGVVFQAHANHSQGTVPLYRFYSPIKDNHFFTASETEANFVKTQLVGLYNYEGIAFYVDV